MSWGAERAALKRSRPRRASSLLASLGVIRAELTSAGPGHVSGLPPGLWGRLMRRPGASLLQQTAACSHGGVRVPRQSGGCQHPEAQSRADTPAGFCPLCPDSGTQEQPPPHDEGAADSHPSEGVTTQGGHSGGSWAVQAALPVSKASTAEGWPALQTYTGARLSVSSSDKHGHPFPGAQPAPPQPAHPQPAPPISPPRADPKPRGGGAGGVSSWEGHQGASGSHHPKTAGRRAAPSALRGSGVGKAPSGLDSGLRDPP